MATKSNINSSVKHNLVYQPCYNCKTKKNDYFDSEYGYDLVKCTNCGLIYVNPRPDDKYITNATMLGVHTGINQRVVTGSYHRYKINIFLGVLRDLYTIDSFQEDGMKWLDIGCGFGEFIEALQCYSGDNLSITGIDPNQAKIHSARKQGLTVKSVGLDELDDKYDFISLLNVYSHLANPEEFLNKLRKYLTQEGELLLQTGHICHLPKEHHPKPYDLPDHLSFANKEIVVNILERLGFEIIDVKLYRSSVYPRYFEIIKIIKLLIKIIIRRGERIDYLYPKYPDTDMYIRCRLVKNTS